MRNRIKDFQDTGIRGVDLYLSCFGPALEEFSRHWPVRRGTPRPEPETKRRQRQADLDPLTEWFVLAWDAFQAPHFPYDEGLRLARVVGLDIDREVIGRVAEKKASNVCLWDSAMRAAKGALGSADGSRG